MPGSRGARSAGEGKSAPEQARHGETGDAKLRRAAARFGSGPTRSPNTARTKTAVERSSH